MYLVSSDSVRTDVVVGTISRIGIDTVIVWSRASKQWRCSGFGFTGRTTHLLSRGCRFTCRAGSTRLLSRG